MIPRTNLAPADLRVWTLVSAMSHKGLYLAEFLFPSTIYLPCITFLALVFLIFSCTFQKSSSCLFRVCFRLFWSLGVDFGLTLGKLHGYYCLDPQIQKCIPLRPNPPIDSDTGSWIQQGLGLSTVENIGVGFWVNMHEIVLSHFCICRSVFLNIFPVSLMKFYSFHSEADFVFIEIKLLKCLSFRLEGC